MDASCKIQRSIHTPYLIYILMCPGFWVHIKSEEESIRKMKKHKKNEEEMLAESEERTVLSDGRIE